MMRRSRKPDIADQLLSEDQPLDKDEQQAVIAVLEEQHLQQNRTFRLSFAGIAVLIGLFFIYAAYQQRNRPYEARYTGELRPVTQPQAVAAVLLLQGTALLVACFALIKELPRRGERARACMPIGLQMQLALGTAVVLASIGCIYWSAALQRSIWKYGYDIGAKWELLWLPVLPLGYCLICCYVVYSIQSVGNDVQKLRKMQYDFKKV